MHPPPAWGRGGRGRVKISEKILLGVAGGGSEISTLVVVVVVGGGGREGSRNFEVKIKTA